MDQFIVPFLNVCLGGVIMYGLYMITDNLATKILFRQKQELKGKYSDVTLPLRLQAYERMCLYLERITPSNLLLRLAPTAVNALDFQQILLTEIREEYNHNIAQQMYISSNAWEQVTNAMNEVVSVINQASSEVSQEDPASNLAKKIFARVIEKETQPTAFALKTLKDELGGLF